LQIPLRDLRPNALAAEILSAGADSLLRHTGTTEGTTVIVIAAAESIRSAALETIRSAAPISFGAVHTRSIRPVKA
jgi:hypothetical protein